MAVGGHQITPNRRTQRLMMLRMRTLMRKITCLVRPRKPSHSFLRFKMMMKKSKRTIQIQMRRIRMPYSRVF